MLNLWDFSVLTIQTGHWPVLITSLVIQELFMYFINFNNPVDYITFSLFLHTTRFILVYFFTVY